MNGAVVGVDDELAVKPVRIFVIADQQFQGELFERSGQPSMRRLPLSTENVPSGRLFLLLRIHISSCARDAAAVQSARGLRAVRGALTGVAFGAIS